MTSLIDLYQYYIVLVPVILGFHLGMVIFRDDEPFLGGVTGGILGVGVGLLLYGILCLIAAIEQYITPWNFALFILATVPGPVYVIFDRVWDRWERGEIKLPKFPKPKPNTSSAKMTEAVVKDSARSSHDL